MSGYPIIPGRVSRLTLDLTKQCYMASKRGSPPKAANVPRELRRALIIAYSVVDARRRQFMSRNERVQELFGYF